MLSDLDLNVENITKEMTDYLVTDSPRQKRNGWRTKLNWEITIDLYEIEKGYSAYRLSPEILDDLSGFIKRMTSVGFICDSHITQSGFFVFAQKDLK